MKMRFYRRETTQERRDRMAAHEAKKPEDTTPIPDHVNRAMIEFSNRDEVVVVLMGNTVVRMSMDPDGSPRISMNNVLPRHAFHMARNDLDVDQRH